MLISSILVLVRFQAAGIPAIGGGHSAFRKRAILKNNASVYLPVNVLTGTACLVKKSLFDEAINEGPFLKTTMLYRGKQVAFSLDTFYGGTISLVYLWVSRN